jgi:hypothetical protein
MIALLRNTVLILVVWLQLSGVSFGKQVYLQDGGVLECESFWKRGEQVVVKVNRDIVLYFEPNEIDARRTFPPPRKKSRHLRRQKAAGAALTTGAATPAARAAIPAPAAPAELASEQPSPPAPAPVSAAKQVTPSAPVSAAKRIPLPARAPATPAAVTAASPAPSPAPSAREEVQPEPAQPAPGDAASPPDKAEMERRHLQAVAMMAEAIQKKDPELMKKAMEAQRSAMEAQRSAMPQNKGRAAVLGLKFMLILLVISLLIVVSMWVMFEKAGNSGWKSLVPIYNVYTLIEISGKPGWWVFLLFIPVVGFVFSLLAMLSLAEKFGRSALFGIGLAFLPMFFFPMLAFGGSQYEQFELLEPELAELG